MSDAAIAGHTFGLWLPVVLAIIAVLTVIANIIKQKKRVENPRVEKDIKRELRILLNSKDSKMSGLLLAWCILTSFMIAQGIIFGGDELANWLQAIFLLVLLIMAIKGRGSRLYIFIISALLSVLLFWGCATTTGTSLKTNCILSDWSKASLCSSIPDYAWENEARISRIGGAIMGVYYGITALYFCFSKKIKRHFIWGERQAELWRELEARDKAGKLKPHIDDKTKSSGRTEQENNKSDEDDIRELLKELKEQNKKLAKKIDKLEKGGIKDTEEIDKYTKRLDRKEEKEQPEKDKEISEYDDESL